MNRRINRATFWLVYGIILALDLTLAYFGSINSSLVMVFAVFCVFRLHDLGLSGKWALLVLGIQILGVVIAYRYVPEHQIPTALYLIDGLILPAIVWLGSTPGEPVSNGWGGPPAPGIGLGRN